MNVFRTRIAAVVAVALPIIAASCATSARYPSTATVRGAYPPRNLQELRPLTRPERTGFTETSTYADVMAFIDSLRAISPTLHVTRLGQAP